MLGKDLLKIKIQVCFEKIGVRPGEKGEKNSAFRPSFVPAISMRFIRDGSTVVVTRNGRTNRRFHKLRFYAEKFQDYYERKEKKNRKVKAKPRDGVVSGIEDGVRNSVQDS